MQLVIAIGWFLIGFLTNAIIWRLQAQKYEDIIYPIGILLLVAATQVLRLYENRERNSGNNPS